MLRGCMRTYCGRLAYVCQASSGGVKRGPGSRRASGREGLSLVLCLKRMWGPSEVWRTFYLNRAVVLSFAVFLRRERHGSWRDGLVERTAGSRVGGWAESFSKERFIAVEGLVSHRERGADI